MPEQPERRVERSSEVARLRRRLADVERHLSELPPHGGAVRADLEATRRDLQRRLAGRS